MHCHEHKGYIDNETINNELGKNDVESVVLFLWPDDELPELCPVRRLLAWFHISGIKEGYFFPSLESLQMVRDSDGLSETQIGWDMYQHRFTTVTDVILGNHERKFGSHTNRKTGYLLAVWGGGGDIEIMEGARHKTLANAKKYRQDALLQLEYAKINRSVGELAQISSTWKPIYCKNVQLARANVNRRFLITNLIPIARDFIESKLGFKDNDSCS